MDGDEGQAVTEVNAAQEAADDAAFNSGFSSATDNTASPVTLENDASGNPLVSDPAKIDGNEEDPAAIAAAEEAARVAAETEARAKAEAEANAPASLTQAQVQQLLAAAGQLPQLQAELARTRDTTAGKIGTLHQQMADFKAAAAKAGASPSPRHLKRLEAEFPELATLLKEDLYGPGDATAPAAGDNQEGQGNASGQAPGANPTVEPPQAPADPMSDPRVMKVLREQAQTIVDVHHPDWKQLAGTPEFKEWRTNLPPAAQHLLANSWDSNVLVPAFNDFKTWSAKRQETAQAQADANKQRDKRLEHATPATTGRATGNNAVDEDAAFLDGFKQARK